MPHDRAAVLQPESLFLKTEFLLIMDEENEYIGVIAYNVDTVCSTEGCFCHLLNYHHVRHFMCRLKIISVCENTMI